MQTWLPPPPNFVGNGSWAEAPRNSSLLRHPPYVPNQMRAPVITPGRDTMLYEQSLATLDPRPVKSSYKPRKTFWAPKREIVNNAPLEVYNPVEEAQRKEHQRAAAKVRDWQGLDPAKSGRDADGNIAGGILNQYVEQRPYGLDAELMKPSRKAMWDRYEAPFHNARQPELMTLTPIPKPGGAHTGYEAGPGAKDVYTRSQRDGAPAASPIFALSSRDVQAGVGYAGRIYERQADRTSIATTPYSQPPLYTIENQPPRSDNLWDSSRKRGVDSLSPLPSQITNPFMEYANRAGDRLNDKAQQIKTERESVSYRPAGSANVPWAPSNVARSVQFDTNQHDHQSANKRFVDVQPPKSYFPRHTNRQTLMPQTERRLPVESVTRSEIFALDPTDPRTLDVLSRRGRNDGGFVFSQRGRSLEDLKARVAEKSAM